jgi:predicted DNA-binding protein YlxM (UPF0122 family)
LIGIPYVRDTDDVSALLEGANFSQDSLADNISGEEISEENNVTYADICESIKTTSLIFGC